MDELDDPDIGWQDEIDGLDDLSDLHDLDDLGGVDDLDNLDMKGILDINLNGRLHQFISLL